MQSKMLSFVCPIVLAAAMLWAGATVCHGAKSQGVPNILFILADDLAWSDLGCYGHPWHQTPHLDRLSASGMRMTNGYAPAPICSASRASILTGKSTARLGFEFVTKDHPGVQVIDAPTKLVAPAFKLNLPLSEQTIAEYMNTAGYETAFFGKWHVSQHHGGYLGWSPTHGPGQQGFQIANEDFGAHPYAWKKSPPVPIDTRGTYADDSMVNQVSDYLSAKKDRPFFAIVSSFYVHTPVKTPCLWLIDHYDAIIPSDVKNRKQRIAYAAFVQTLDHHIGTMLDALEAGGQRDDTLIVFMSDNGGHPEYAGNAPLRGSKWNLYEGGVRVPFIFSWPGHVPPNSQCDLPAIGYDLLPTFVELSGNQLSPKNRRTLDGLSLVPLLQGAADPPPRDFIWHFPYYHPERTYSDAIEAIGVNDFAVSKTRPQSALRRGRYKLLWFAEDDRVELYDLQSDPAEQNDLATKDPETANRLRDSLHRYLRDCSARMAKPPSAAPP